MKRISFLLILCLQALLASAQSTVRLQGSVQDAFLKRGLFDCVLSVMRADSTAVECNPEVYEVGADSMHITTVFQIDIPNVAGTYLVRVQKEGYEEGWATVEVPKGNKLNMLNVPTIEIRRAISTTLKEVVVQATRVKMYYRGDTLVYDATAFQMPEGSMLQDLIKQLPGASLNEAGEIFINGRKVDELTLNSKSFFKGNKKVLMENLPYFTVKELKVFERNPLWAALAGKEAEEKEYIMDVDLKPEYSVGTIANVEAAGGTHERYQFRAFDMVLTPKVAFGAFANLNNINDENVSTHNGWYMQQGLNFRLGQNRPTTRLAAGFTLSYQSDKEWKFGYKETMNMLDLWYDHYNSLDETNTYQERFLPTGTAFSRSQRSSRDKFLALQVRNELIKLTQNIHFWNLFSFKQTDNKQGSSLLQWDSNDTTATQMTNGLGRTRQYYTSFMQENRKFKGTYIHSLLQIMHTDRDVFNRQSSASLISGTGDYRHEYNDGRSGYYHINQSIDWSKDLGKRLTLRLEDIYNFRHDKADDQLYLLQNLVGWGQRDSVALDLLPSNRELMRGIYDLDNSLRSRMQSHNNTLTPSLKFKKTDHFPVDITLALPILMHRERLDYERGPIDTLAHHTLLAVNPTLSLRHQNWRASAGMTTSSPGMMNLIPYRDARNPLNILEGNPHLKNNRKLNGSVTYEPKLKRRQSGLTATRLSTGYDYYLRSVAQGFTYDEQTGAYTHRPENIEGNWAWNTTWNATLSLHDNQRWWLDNQTGCNVLHSVDYAAVSGYADSQINHVQTTNTSESLKLSYKAKNTKVSLLGDMMWRRSWGERLAESISAWDYRYGVNAQQTISRWQTTLNVDATMQCRRGYGNAAMNKDEFVVNASIMQPILHGKIKLTLEGHDIFQQLSSTQYEVNAQGRTETWYRIIPSYVMLRVMYQFNKHPKKNK